MYATGGNDRSNSIVSSWRQKMVMDGDCLTVEGNEFHARAAATGKARSPSVERRVDGTRSVRASDERWRRWVSAAKWSEVDRYDGAVPCKQRYTRTHNRNCILSVTFSQWRLRRYGVTWSDLRLANTSRAAALRADCRRLIWVPEIPTSAEQQQSTLLMTRALKRTMSASRVRERCTLRICLRTEKHALTLAVTWVVSVTSELIWKPRSRTVVTEDIKALPS